MRVFLRAAPWFSCLAGILATRVCIADPPVPWQIHPASPQLQLGADRSVDLDLVGPDVTAADLEVVVSVGAIRDVRRVAVGHFTARYEPPTSRAPDLAVIVARVRGSSSIGTATISMLGRYHLSLTVEPLARVTVRVGESEIDHATVPRSGVLDLFLHVPPGARSARIDAIDPTGNSTQADESLDVPPLHRVLLLRTNDIRSDATITHSLIVLANSDGTFSPTAPHLDVSGATFTAAATSPGVFQITAQAQRSIEPISVVIRSLVEATISTPASLIFAIPPVIPARIEISENDPLHVGDPWTVAFRVLGTDGFDIGGLVPYLHASVGNDRAAIATHDEEYVLSGRAPDQVETLPLAIRFQHPGIPDIAMRTDLVVHAAAIARIVADPVSLVLQQEHVVELRSLDRFGNPAALTNPSVHVTGGELVSVSSMGSRITVRFVPLEHSVRLAVSLGREFQQNIDLVAASPPSHPLWFELALTGLWNLGSLFMGGGRLSVGVQFPLTRRIDWFAGIDGGYQTGTVNDGQNTVATTGVIPLFARVGATMRFGRFEVGPLLFGGTKIVSVQVRLSGGDNLRQTVIIPTFGGALMVRVQTVVGRFSAQIGGETGVLDSVPARGTLGGLNASLGWGLRF